MSPGQPYLVGLTGSIGMGKTETAKMFAQLGIPVFDADAAVHGLYESGEAVTKAVARAFPGAVRNGQVDRNLLAQSIGADRDALDRLEAIVHPLVTQAQEQFVQQATVAGSDLAVLDIPLLFETGQHVDMDSIVVVSAPDDVQKARVLDRPGMTQDKLDRLLARQMPSAEKRAQAHFVVETDKGFDHAFEQVKQIVAQLRARRPQDKQRA